MKKRITITTVLGVCCALPLVASAGAPGSADRKAALKNVCAAGRHAGQVCDPTDVDPCGTNQIGVPFDCVVDFSQRPSLKGTLTLIADEAPSDNNALGGNPTITVLLEFQAGGQPYVVAKTFQGALPGQFPEIGHWLPPVEADEIHAIVNSFVYQTPIASLEGIGQALMEIAEREFVGTVDLSSSTPVIFQLKATPAPSAIDQYAGAQLGQVARFEIEIRFVETS
jgi:hypothetical protein